MSEVSEGPSEPGSPVKAGMNGKMDVSIEEVHSAPLGQPSWLEYRLRYVCWHLICRLTLDNSLRNPPNLLSTRRRNRHSLQELYGRSS